METLREWAAGEFGTVRVPDRRNRRRLIELTAKLAKNPSGTVASVYSCDAERQAAYDLLGNRAVHQRELVSSMAGATARRCKHSEFVYVAIDGTGMTLADPSNTKPLGSMGPRQFPTRGLLVVDALAVAPNGTPLGLLDVRFWARDVLASDMNRYDQRRSGVTEMRFWNAAMEAATDTLTAHAPAVRPWFVMDREADEMRILGDVSDSDALFTIRVRQDRVVEHRGRRSKLYATVRDSKPIARGVVCVQRTPKRAARRANVELRAIRTTLVLRDVDGHERDARIAVNVIEVRERSARADRLQWVLLTNASIGSADDVYRVVESYKARWKIEEFHRTWKSGSCGLEDIQLRSAGAIRKWAIMLAAVAARTERLKHLARTDPDAPATTELNEDEIAALILAKRQIKNRVESVPDGVPTVATAVLWIAQLGGYSERYKKGARPGAVTIARGLDRLAIWTDAYLAARTDLENEKKVR